MDADDLIERDGKQAVGIIVPHVLFEGEREAAQIGKAFDHVRGNFRPAEALPVKRDGGGYPLHGLLQAL